MLAFMTLKAIVLALFVALASASNLTVNQISGNTTDLGYS